MGVPDILAPAVALVLGPVFLAVVLRGIYGRLRLRRGLYVALMAILAFPPQGFDLLAQDVQTTVDVAQACEERGALLWTSQRGNPQEADLPSGWLTVREAVTLPDPDTSWMPNPQSRSDYTGWLDDRPTRPTRSLGI